MISIRYKQHTIDVWQEPHHRAFTATVNKIGIPYFPSLKDEEAAISFAKYYVDFIDEVHPDYLPSL